MHDGNLFFLNQHEDAADRWLDSRPVCSVCGEPIQDEYKFDTARGLMCEDCAEAYADQLAEEFKRDCMDDWRRMID